MSSPDDPSVRVWTSYFDALDAAVRDVAIAVSGQDPPPWPAGLATPRVPLPRTLAGRLERAVAATQAVHDITAACRDTVAAELSSLARHTVGREAAGSATVGGSLDICG